MHSPIWSIWFITRTQVITAIATCDGFIINMAPVLYLCSYLCFFAMWLCSSSHQDMETTPPPSSESGPVCDLLWPIRCGERDEESELSEAYGGLVCFPPLLRTQPRCHENKPTYGRSCGGKTSHPRGWKCPSEPSYYQQNMGKVSRTAQPILRLTTWVTRLLLYVTEVVLGIFFMQSTHGNSKLTCCCGCFFFVFFLLLLFF